MAVVLAGVLISAAARIDSSAPTPAVTAVANPSRPGAAQPQLTVSARGVLLSWIERNGDRAELKFAERAGTRWSEPLVAAAGDDFFVNWADVPSVLRLSTGTLVAHWLQKNGPGTYAYDVRLAHSADDGRTWSPSFTPHRDGTQTEHGFASLFELPGGGAGVIWLDGRAMAGDAGHGHGSGAMSLRFAAYDRRWKPAAEGAIDTRVCECCPTAAAVTSDGVVAAFRNRSDAEVRDIYVARLAGGRWTEGQPVHDDGWKVPACPVNGPALSAAGRRVAVAWFTLREGQGRSFLAFSSDAGRTFGPPVALDDESSLGRVDVQLLPDGSAIGIWLEASSARADLRGRRIGPGGRRSPSFSIAGLEANRSTGYPRVALGGDELVFAWTETSPATGGSGVRTAVARLQDVMR